MGNGESVVLELQKGKLCSIERQMDALKKLSAGSLYAGAIGHHPAGFRFVLVTDQIFSAL